MLSQVIKYVMASVGEAELAAMKWAGCWETAGFGGRLFKHTVVLKSSLIQLMIILTK
jgi:hypothetical protein